MVITKFNIGQRVRHKLLGYLGVIIDVDPEYSLEKPSLDEISAHNSLKNSPWYHVVMEDDEGKPMHTYLAEAQIGIESFSFSSEKSALDELAKSIRRQLQAPRLRN